MSISEASVISPSGLVRWAPFGVPVVPEVRMTKRGFSGGGARAAGAPGAVRRAADRSPPRRPPRGRGAVVPGDDPPHRRVDAGQQALELLVVDQRLRPLAVHHV